MFFAFIGEFAGHGAVNADNLLRSSKCDQGLVGANISSQYFVQFVADCHYTFAAPDVPNDAKAFCSSSSTTSEQQSTITAEFENSWLTFGERQHAQRLHRF